MHNVLDEREETLSQVPPHAERVALATAEAEGIGQLSLDGSPELLALGSLGYDVQGVVVALEFLVLFADLVEGLAVVDVGFVAAAATTLITASSAAATSTAAAFVSSSASHCCV